MWCQSRSCTGNNVHPCTLTLTCPQTALASHPFRTASRFPHTCPHCRARLPSLRSSCMCGCLTHSCKRLLCWGSACLVWSAHQGQLRRTRCTKKTRGEDSKAGENSNSAKKCKSTIFCSTLGCRTSKISQEIDITPTGELCKNVLLREMTISSVMLS